jgi:hypothetical protein
MTNVNPVIGWTSSYFSSYPTVEFTKERRKALVDRIKKRKYNFNYQDHQYLSYCAPFYSDNVLCVLTKQEWDSVMDEAWADYPRGARLMPEDEIDREPINSVLYEKEKWEPKDGDIDE